jgi:hypothetical protein
VGLEPSSDELGDAHATLRPNREDTMLTVGEAQDAGYRWLRLYWKDPGASSYAVVTDLSERPRETLLLDWANAIGMEKKLGHLAEISVVCPDRIHDTDPEKFELRVWWNDGT